MRLKVTKPIDGEFSIQIDDRRGATGVNLRRKGVKVGDAKAALTEVLQEYLDAREALPRRRR